MLSREQRIQLFMSLFRGREDVFARRFEKWNKSIAGYAPAYIGHDKEHFQVLTAEWVEKHLLGTSTLGIYPLLPDNTCYFIAVDFDGDGWEKATLALVTMFKKYSIPIAIERSRSGNGAHAWCFFTESYSAAKARKIFLSLLREAKILDEYERDESYDRLFPSQDFLSGKGLGNLIALPLQGIPRKSGNSLFTSQNTPWLATGMNAQRESGGGRGTTLGSPWRRAPSFARVENREVLKMRYLVRLRRGSSFATIN